MIPNWKRLGFDSREECVGHILKFLKENEKPIIKVGNGDPLAVMYGDVVLMLGKENNTGFAKKKK